MRIGKELYENNTNIAQPCNINNKQNLPAFKASGGMAGTLNLFGQTMQNIENGGFLVSFIIQDALGMTVPRVGTAFLRDKDVTGEYNVQEGLEVLGREGITGPCMMAIAPAMFALAAKFGKSTSVNSQLIKRFGNSLKDFVKNPNFDKTLLNNSNKFKQEFYRTNIREILHNTVGKENVTEDSIKYILDCISRYEKIPADAKLKRNIFGFTNKNKYRKGCLKEISDYINNIKFSTSSELGMLDKVKVGSNNLNDIRTFSTSNAIESMIKYSDDAISLNKHLNSLDSSMAENIKNSSLAKRFITNITTIITTLSVLSLLPKLYIKSDVSPGARTAMLLKENQLNSQKSEQNNNANPQDAEESAQNRNEVSFHGKKPDNSWLSKLGKKLSKFMDKEFVANELEYNGHNFTNSLMAGLSLFGLLAPRGLKAYKRAQVDEDGKKDLTELYEILIRDISSSLSVVFAVPMLTRAAVTSYENQSGFVLMHKDRTKHGFATAIDLLNPYSSSHVLKNSEIDSLYNHIDSKEKMLNFCKYIDENGGDLQKIISKSENANIVFNDKGIKLSEIEKLSKKEKNEKIIKFFKEFGNNKDMDKKSVDGMISKLMKGSATKPGKNKILGFARGLNSVPGVITTFIISPVLLGWFIPRLTYANTRRIHEKKEREKENKTKSINTAV